jgi:hypothetical protein
MRTHDLSPGPDSPVHIRSCWDFLMDLTLAIMGVGGAVLLIQVQFAPLLD